MNCEQARNLFDAYLDKGMSPSLETEFGAHRLQCAQCRHELALMEVAGHVISADGRAEDTLDPEFTQRLLACVDSSRPAGLGRRRAMWIGGSVLAAAASLLIVFTLFFSGPEARVAGKRVVNPTPPEYFEDEPVVDSDLDLAADSLVKQVESTWTTRKDSADSIIHFGEMTIMQILDRLGIDNAVEPAEPFEPLPESFDELAPGDDIEDL